MVELRNSAVVFCMMPSMPTLTEFASNFGLCAEAPGCGGDFRATCSAEPRSPPLPCYDARESGSSSRMRGPISSLTLSLRSGSSRMST
eukprot:6409418-Alexandrium_andersonii.AAC.1